MTGIYTTRRLLDAAFQAYSVSVLLGRRERGMADFMGDVRSLVFTAGVVYRQINCPACVVVSHKGN